MSNAIDKIDRFFDVNFETNRWPETYNAVRKLGLMEFSDKGVDRLISNPKLINNKLNEWYISYN